MINPFSTGRSGRPDRRRRTLSLESLEPRALLSAVPFAARPDLVDASDLGFSARDNKTNDTTPTFEGTARNAESVKIIVNGTEVGTAPVVDGRWTFTHPGLADGRHAVAVQAVGAEEQLGRRTAPLRIQVSTAAPAVPTLGLVQRGSRPATSGEAATNQARPSFTGQGPARGLVEVSVDGTSVGAGLVRGGRRFVVRPTGPIASGVRTVTAVATDVYGNTSGPATLTLTVDAVAPVVESLVRTSFDTLTATFSEAVKGITPASFRFSGRTAEGFRVSSRPLTNGQLRAYVGAISGELSADGRTYTITAPNLDLAAGEFTVTLPRGGRVTDLAGNRLSNAASVTETVEGSVS